MTDFATLNSGCAIVCHTDHHCDQGVGTLWRVLLADGFLIDCGHSRFAEARAHVLADIINNGGDEQWNRLSREALLKWKSA